MCVKTFLHFTKCDHIVTSVTLCPTHHKQQASAEGVLGCLFRRDLRKQKDCGRLIPHHLQDISYCQTCPITKGQFTAQPIGQGAYKVSKKVLPEMPHDLEKASARRALRETEKQRQRGQGPIHEVICTQTSVWLPDLYENPEALATKAAGSREAVKAPPVPYRHEVKDRPAEVSTKPTREKAQYMPTYGRQPQPMIRPVQPAPTYRSSSRKAHACVPSPGRTSYNSSDNRPSGAASGHIDPLRRPDRAQSTAGTHREQRSPRRQAYESPNAKPKVLSSLRLPSPRESPLSPRPDWERNLIRTSPKKAGMMSDLYDRTRTRASTNDSDVSFVCQTSKALADQQPLKDKRKSSRRSAGSIRSWSRRSFLS
ncbi:hypothetical protein F4808DRAFT_469393 [Astrocystis sublimbata]|nr:hypothetical protein F4808DRAFT_469393 [Astrocystis sublimbata]